MLISRSWVRAGKTCFQLGGLFFFYFGFPFHFSSARFRLVTIYRLSKCKLTVLIDFDWVGIIGDRRWYLKRKKKPDQGKKCRLQRFRGRCHIDWTHKLYAFSNHLQIICIWIHYTGEKQRERKRRRKHSNSSTKMQPKLLLLLEEFLNQPQTIWNNTGNRIQIKDDIIENYANILITTFFDITHNSG